MDNFGVAGKGLRIQGHPVGEAAAHRQQQVAGVAGDVAGLGAVHPDHTGGQGIAPGKGAGAHDGDGGGGVHPPGQGTELLRRAAPDHAAAANQQGPLRFSQQLRQRVQVLLPGLRGHNVVGGVAHQPGQTPMRSMFRQGEGLIVPLRGGDILLYINQNRTGPPGTGQSKGFPDHIRQGGHIPHQIIALCDGQADAGDINFLKGILPHEGAVDVAGYKDHGGGVHIGGGDTGGEVGGAGTGGGEADSHLAGGAGVTVRGVGRPLFVGGENVANAVTVVIEGVVDVEDGSAGITEHGIHPLLQQTFNEDIRAFAFHVPRFPLFSVVKVK